MARTETIFLTLKEVDDLFPKHTVGAKMKQTIPVVRNTVRIKDVQAKLLAEIKTFDTINYIYVVNGHRRLIGVVSMRELFLHTGSKKIESIMTKKVISVLPTEAEESAALLSLQHSLKSVPVIDRNNRLVGIFTSDDLLELLNKRLATTLSVLAGIYPGQKHNFSELFVLRQRLRWLITGVLGGIVTALWISVYKGTLESMVILATYFPVIMTAGATTTNQSAMIFIKRLIMDGMKKGIWHYFWKELRGALIMGNFAALVGALVIYFLNNNPWLSLVMYVSLFLAIIASTIIGVFVPYLLHRMKIDPAAGTGPFLTIIKDIIVLTIYLTLATSLLGFF